MIYLYNNENVTHKPFQHANGTTFTAGAVQKLTEQELTALDITVQAEPTPEPPAEPSPLEQLLQQAEAVRLALIDAVQAQYQAVQQSIGADFQSSAEFKTFAGFANAFQIPAQQFGAWEAEVWHQANVYKLQVMQGQAPMLTPEQAVAMMPAYPLP